MSTLNSLQEWYRKRCDGRWEHAYGITIQTLDNPGWGLDCNLQDTVFATREFEKVTIERSETDWIHCWVENTIFKARGGPLNLEEMLERFLFFVGTPDQDMLQN